jgi:hypothetical protein
VGLGKPYDKLEGALEYGGVDKPRATPLRNMRAALGLAGLGAVAVAARTLQDDDDKNKGPVVPTPSNSPSVTPSVSPSTGPSVQPTPSPSATTPTPGTSTSPGQPTTPGQPNKPGQPGQPVRPRHTVVVNGDDPSTGTLWGIADHNVHTLLLGDEQRDAKARGGQDAVVLQALEQLIQINPQRHFRPELMDGKVTGVPGDPDLVRNGWALNVDRFEPTTNLVPEHKRFR